MNHTRITHHAWILLLLGAFQGLLPQAGPSLTWAHAAPSTDEPSLLGTDMEPLLSVATGAYDLPETLCRKTSKDVIIDGKLDEAAWQSASGLNFVDVVTAGPPLCGASEGFLLWNDKSLYVAVRARDKNTWATMTLRDSPLCQEEVIEVFIDPDGDQKRYVEIEINPLNAIFDLRYAPDASGAIKEDKTWNCPGLRHAVVVDGTLNRHDDIDREWTLEMAIPWEAFKGLNEEVSLPPKEGDTWRLNLYRYERPNGPASPDRPVEYTAWSPTRHVNFHIPACFGKTIFSHEDSDLRASTCALHAAKRNCLEK